MELTWAIIWNCLMQVPVRHWRTLFHYLGRLDATFAEARAEGRPFVNWHLREDGVIWVSDWGLTEGEQERSCALPVALDPAPWTRAALALDPPSTLHPACTATVLVLHHGWTRPAPCLGTAPTALKPP